MLLFGSGHVDLTPPESLPLGGYTERRGAVFQAGGDVLWARARAVGDVMLVSVEMLTMPESLVAAVQARTGERKLFMAATHTHCAPDSQMLNDRMTILIPGIAPFRRRWMEWYADRIAIAIKMARQNQNREIANFQLRQTPVPLARSRRPLGAPENTAAELDVVLAGGGTEPLFRIFGAHPTLFDSDERRLRGDWPGELMSRHGGLAFTGAIGDASPVPTVAGDRLTQSISFADTLARSLSRAPFRSISAEGLRYLQVPILIDRPVPHPDFAKANGVTDAIAQSVVSKFAPAKGMLSGIAFGNFVLLGVPGEPTGELARAIREQAQPLGLRVAVTSHVNGWIGYILSEPDYDRGGYEAQLSMHGSKTGTHLVQASRSLLKRLSYPKPGTGVQKPQP